MGLTNEVLPCSLVYMTAKAKIMEEMDLDEAAQMYYRRFLETFPDSSMAPKIKAKLGQA